MDDSSAWRACDRCYATKERCRRNDGHSVCSRCQRLSYSCTTTRDAFRPGRRMINSSQRLVRAGPKEKPSSAYFFQTEMNGTNPTPPLSLAPNPSIPPFLFQCRLSDENLLSSTRSHDQFLQYFVHGINFVPSLGTLVQSRIMQHPELVKEGLLACAGAVFRARSKLSGFDDVDMSRSAVALRKLRYAPVAEDQVGVILTLGNLLVTYELLTSSQLAHAITRFTLSLIQPLYYSQPAFEMPTELISLVFLDIVECLVRREIPIIQFRVEDFTLIDRFAGLCCPLLPMLYELCQVGNIYARDGPQNEREKRLLAEHLRSLNARLSTWKPTPTPGFVDQFCSKDVIFLLTQARVYKGVALLILHRLQHPFGDGDDLGIRLSYYIQSESSLCIDLLSANNAIPKTLFPWMIAALEITRCAEREALLAQVPAVDREIMAMPIARMKEFIRFVWAARDMRDGISWFDLVASAPPFSVMP
jgi:Fungal specific transcription factor domain/Fungal Zn(2)-Cys(6) binuclear cluster domain